VVTEHQSAIHDALKLDLEKHKSLPKKSSNKDEDSE
jgi:hypothetical protein